MAIRVGISGWRYAPWRGVFYPRGLPQRQELEFAAERMTTIEVNGSFYALQRPDSYRAWAQATPDDFVLSVKGPRFVTHMKKLADVGTPLAKKLASGVPTSASFFMCVTNRGPLTDSTKSSGVACAHAR